MVAGSYERAASRLGVLFDDLEKAMNKWEGMVIGYVITQACVSIEMRNRIHECYWNFR
jgi:hypothetical protein